jgi:peptide deformylase
MMSEVLELGDPRLRAVSLPVDDVKASAHRADAERLSATLEGFRRAQGFGRAIAAPQIGIARRFIALNLGKGPQVIANPVVLWKSDATFTMWDDCMSFPSLLVRVERHRSISVRYVDEAGDTREWSNLDIATSELLQHEIDHLDGILAVDLATGRDAIITRTTYDRHRPLFDATVDYRIGD